MNPPATSGWRVVGASVPGASHLAADGICQDDHDFAIAGPPAHHPALLVAVADGAGSAPHSATGAKVAIQSFFQSVLTSLADQPVEALAAAVPSWLTDLRTALGERAMQDARPLADYACTFMGAVLGDNDAILIHIGDGIIAYRTAPHAPWTPATWPQTGEYRNTTYFITDDGAMEQIAVSHVAEPVLQLALSTDGLTDLCLDLPGRLLHQPFFDSLLETFEAADGVADDAEIKAALSRFLESPQVVAESNDAKTLVLASRAPMPATSGPS